MKENIKEGIDEYVAYGRPPGGFLMAVLTNNLRESFARADAENRVDMFEIVSYLWNEIPAAAWGSEMKVTAWMREGGLVGKAELSEIG